SPRASRRRSGLSLTRRRERSLSVSGSKRRGGCRRPSARARRRPAAGRWWGAPRNWSGSWTPGPRAGGSGGRQGRGAKATRGWGRRDPGGRWWRGRGSAAAAGAAGRDLARAPVLFLLTAAAQPPRDELDELRVRIGRELAGTAVRLGPLAPDALRTLARWALPAFGDVELDRITRRVATDSAGIPLLAVELLHAVASGLDLRETGGAWPEPLHTLDQTLPGDLPDAIVAAIRIEFRRLSPDAQRVLVVAAVLNGRVPGPILGQRAGLAGEALATALDELEWQRWL